MYDSLLLTSFFLRLANKPSALQHHQVPLLTWKRKPSSPQPSTLLCRLSTTFGSRYNAMLKPNFVLTLLRSKFGINHSFLVYSLHSKESLLVRLFNISTFSAIKFNCRVRCIAYFLPYSYLETTSQLSPHAHLQLWLFCACPIIVLKQRDLLPSSHRARPSIRPVILLLFQFLSAQSN